MSIDLSRNAKFIIKGHDVERVDKFIYRGSVITTTGGAGDNMRTRTRKARKQHLPNSATSGAQNSSTGRQKFDI
jgi:hypothetical protein